MSPRGHPPCRPAPLLALLAWLAAGPPATAQSYLDWAGACFTAAERAAGEAAPRRDADHDGWPNLIEYAIGTHPRDPHSRPQPSFPDGESPAVCCPLPAGDKSTGLRLLISPDLINWHPAPAVLVAGDVLTAPAGADRFVRIEVFALPGDPLDSDGDGLHDLFEEQLVNASAADSLTDIGDVTPLGDSDGDGIPNIAEEENRRPAGCGFPGPPLLDPDAVAAAADRQPPAAATALSVHTPLR